jgi:WD40 repeat protein
MNEVRRLVDRQIPSGNQVDFRGMEWEILNRDISAPATLVLRGHEGPVYDLAVVPHRPWIVSAGEDRQMRVWDLQTGRLVKSLEMADGPLYAVAVSPDGRRVASGNEELALWDLESGRRVRVLQTKLPSSIESLAISHDGTRVAVGCRYEKVFIASVDDGSILAEDKDPARHEFIGFSADDQLLYSHVKNFEGVDFLRKWNRDLTAWYTQYMSRQLRVMALASDGRWIAATGEQESRLVIFNAESGEVLKSSSGHGEGAKAVAVSADSRVVVVGRMNGLMQYFYRHEAEATENIGSEIDVATSRVLPAHEGVIFSVVPCPDGRFASAGADGLVRVSAPPEVNAHSCDGPENTHIVALHRNPATGLLAAVSSNQIWIETVPRQWRRCPELPGPVADMAFTSDGRHIWIAQANRGLAILDIQASDEIQFVEPTQEVPHAIAFSPDGAWGVLGFHKHVDLFALPGWRKQASFATTGNAVEAVFSPRGERLACLIHGEVIHVFDVNRKREAAAFRVGSRGSHVAWHGENHLASSHQGGEIHLWDIANTRRIRTFVGHEGGTISLTFSSDGKTLISSGEDGSIKLWQVATAQLLGALHVPPVRHASDEALQPVPVFSSLSLGPDGHSLAAGCGTGEYQGAGPVLRWRW